jgi:hypothetical protein
MSGEANNSSNADSVPRRPPRLYVLFFKFSTKRITNSLYLLSIITLQSTLWQSSWNYKRRHGFSIFIYIYRILTIRIFHFNSGPRGSSRNFQGGGRGGFQGGERGGGFSGGNRRSFPTDRDFSSGSHYRSNSAQSSDFRTTDQRGGPLQPSPINLYRITVRFIGDFVIPNCYFGQIIGLDLSKYILLRFRFVEMFFRFPSASGIPRSTSCKRSLPILLRLLLIHFRYASNYNYLNLRVYANLNL